MNKVCYNKIHFFSINLFLSYLNKYNLVSFPISFGISPVNWLLDKHNHSKSISFPISFGISPVNWLLDKHNHNFFRNFSG